MQSLIKVVDKGGQFKRFCSQLKVASLSFEMVKESSLSLQDLSHHSQVLILLAPLSPVEQQLLMGHHELTKRDPSKTWIYLATDFNDEEAVSWLNYADGIINMNGSVESLLPLINFAKRMDLMQVSSNNLAQVGSDLNRAASMALEQLQRVKKLHEQVVPIRKEELKGIRLFSKFAAGASSGGEFYDVVKSDNEIVFIISSSDSYLASSSILTHFDQLLSVKSYSKEKLEKFLAHLALELDTVENSKGSKTKVDLFLCKINISNLKLEGWHFGRGELIGFKNQYFAENSFPFATPFFEQAYFSINLQRGDKFTLLSPGLIKNSEGLINGQSLVSFIRDNIKHGPKSLANEIFYQLKKNITGDFLTYDATMVYVEVDEHVIFQI